MTVQTKAVLKTYFLKGLRPTQSNYNDLIDSLALVSANDQFLPLTGGIMTGAIQLPGVPTSALAAANKGYIDAIVSAGGVVIGGSNTQVQYNNAGVLGGFTVSGDAASLATTGVLTLANTAVSAGTYTLPTLTVDSKGRITSAIGASPGFIQQVRVETGAVATGSTILPLDDTIPQSSEGDQYMTLAITPTNSSSKLIIEVIGFFASSSNDNISAALFQDATAVALAAGTQILTTTNKIIGIKFTHTMAAGTTSATTFKVRAGIASTGTITFNGLAGGRIFGGVMASSIIITEYAS